MSVDIAEVFGFEGWTDPESLPAWGWDFAVVESEEEE